MIGRHLPIEIKPGLKGDLALIVYRDFDGKNRNYFSFVFSNPVSTVLNYDLASKNIERIYVGINAKVLDMLADGGFLGENASIDLLDRKLVNPLYRVQDMNPRPL